MKINNKKIITIENIEKLVYHIRGQQVMLDYDLATIYGYEVRALNQQVKRNINRFPEDFMFQLTEEEIESVKSQIATSPNADIYPKLHKDKAVKSQIVTSRESNFIQDKKAEEEHLLTLLQNKESICLPLC